MLFAVRAAVRVFPIVTHPDPNNRSNEALALATARSLLIAGVAAKLPSLRITVEAGAATEAVLTAARAGYRGSDETFVAGVASFASRVAAQTEGNYGGFAIQAHDQAQGAVAFINTEDIFADTNLSFETLSTKPIWHKPEEADRMAQMFAGRTNLLDSVPDWTFWRDWYQGWLTGKHLDWELQRRVALIDNAIWEAGPAAVAAEIETIKAEYLAEKVPQAERIEFNEDTGKFFAVPLDIAKPDLLGATLTQVQDALDDVLANPSNGLRDTSRETRVLNRVFTRYANDPQQIEMGFVSAYKGLTRQILSEELPKSEENLALQDALQEGARGIRATHPEVAENRKILTEQAIREMRPEDIELIEDARPVLAAISDDDLADDWNTDIPQLLNDATTPLPSGAPPLPGADEATRIFSRVSKMKLRYDKITKKGGEIFDSKGFKTVRLGLTVSGLLSALVSLGLFILGIV